MAYDAKRIYGKSAKDLYKKGVQRLENAKISGRNKELIVLFSEHLFAQNCGETRVSKLMYQLRSLASVVDLDLDKLEKKDVQRLLAYINQRRDYAIATKADYRRIIKQFYRWYKGEDDRIYKGTRESRIKVNKFYLFVEKIKKGEKLEPIDPSTILTDEDIQKVVECCRSLKDKALIKLLHETGMRAGELLNIKIKDVKIGEHTTNIIVDGKTGMRNVPITTSVPHITKWLEIHPFREDFESYLWLGENPRNMNEPLMHRGTQKLIDRAFNKSKIDKKHNLHWFRHSRASLLAPHLTESLLCKYMGWTLGGKQVKRYVHLCNQQLEDAYLKMHGLKVEEEEKKKPKKCDCDAINEYNAKYCYKCGRPMSVEVAIQDNAMKNKEIDKTMQVMMEIMQNPKLMKKFQEFKNKTMEEIK